MTLTKSLKICLDGLLTYRRLPILLVLTALLLTLPGLWTGLSVDDHFHREVLTGSDPFNLGRQRAWWDLFNFLDGDPAYNRQLADLGVAPWWLLPELKAAFFRPVTAASHALDYLLWPEVPALMHLQSLAWYATLVVAVSVLYRRLMASAWAAGLAALLYAVDDAHGFPAAWLANRNGVIAALLGVLALTAHHRWCRHGWRGGAWLGPGCLVLGLLANEGAVAVVGYLLAYALFIDDGGWRQRGLQLAPYLVIVVVWRLLHHGFGYGTYGSGLYLDPAREPLPFLLALVERSPLFLLGQWGLAPPQLTIFLSRPAVLAWSVAAVLLLVPIALLLLPLLRRRAEARFWATGMLLSLVPICATFPHDRLLFFVGLGAMALLAQLLDSLRGGAGRRPARALAGLLMAVHLVAAPLLLPIAAWTPGFTGRLMEEALCSTGEKPPLANRDVVLVNAGVPFLAGYLPVLRWANGLSVPAHTRILAAGTVPLQISRPDCCSLRVQPLGGFLSGPMDTLYRGSAHPLRLGQQVVLTGMTVAVTGLTSDGRPAEAVFRFNRPLEDDSLVWLRDAGDHLLPFVPPAVGETTTLPALRFFLQSKGGEQRSGTNRPDTRCPEPVPGARPGLQPRGC